MNLVGAVLACLACMLLWALAEALAELLGNATSKAAAPAWRPLWRMFVRARRPWPALVMTALGAGGVVAGYSIHERPDADWRGGAGVLLDLSWGGRRRCAVPLARRAPGQSPRGGAGV